MKFVYLCRTTVTYSSSGTGDRRYTTNLEIRETVYTDTGLIRDESHLMTPI
jgi:hypothetical protein